ncbi:hypothetical protein RvY_14871 [Ramazzottius varieornatus]|uniref:Uncharacterized protein n=1 Tax=Ramazzottius varieornatus TaxID=947166 RepID=A0A1D1W150_RAMVA|nr:hypothetical protein RvY_14871 [Ramazzottius varieornatus]
MFDKAEREEYGKQPNSFLPASSGQQRLPSFVRGAEKQEREKWYYPSPDHVGRDGSDKNAVQ